MNPKENGMYGLDKIVVLRDSSKCFVVCVVFLYSVPLSGRDKRIL